VLGELSEHGRVELPCRVKLVPRAPPPPVSFTVGVGGSEVGAVSVEEFLRGGVGVRVKIRFRLRLGLGLRWTGSGGVRGGVAIVQMAVGRPSEASATPPDPDPRSLPP
jgi:hypothetical protein